MVLVGHATGSGHAAKMKLPFARPGFGLALLLLLLATGLVEIESDDIVAKEHSLFVHSNSIAITTTTSPFVRAHPDAGLVVVDCVERLVTSTILRHRRGPGNDNRSDMSGRGPDAAHPMVRVVTSSSGAEVWLFSPPPIGNSSSSSSSSSSRFSFPCAVVRRMLNITCDRHSDELRTHRSLDHHALPGAHLQFVHFYVGAQALVAGGFNFFGSNNDDSGRIPAAPGGAAVLSKFHVAMSADWVNGEVQVLKSMESVAAVAGDLAADSLRSSPFDSTHTRCAALHVVFDREKWTSVVVANHSAGGDAEHCESSTVNGTGAVVTRALSGRGFHRSVNTSVALRLSSHASTTSGGFLSTCACGEQEDGGGKHGGLAPPTTKQPFVSILELVGTGMYIDLDETRNRAAYGGPKVVGIEQHIDVERPQYRAHGTVVAMHEPPSSVGDGGSGGGAGSGGKEYASPGVKRWNVQSPMHFRYHQPMPPVASLSSSSSSSTAVSGAAAVGRFDPAVGFFRHVTVPAPLVFCSCWDDDDDGSNGKQKGQQRWHWVADAASTMATAAAAAVPTAGDAVSTIAGAGAAASTAFADAARGVHSNVLFGNPVPVGRDDDYTVVLYGTLSVICCSAVAVLWASMTFDARPPTTPTAGKAPVVEQNTKRKKVS